VVKRSNRFSPHQFVVSQVTKTILYFLSPNYATVGKETKVFSDFTSAIKILRDSMVCNDSNNNGATSSAQTFKLVFLLKVLTYSQRLIN